MEVRELRLLLKDAGRQARPLDDILAEIREEKVDIATLEEAVQANREQLQEFMRRNGLTSAEQAADYFGLPAGTLSRWLNSAQSSNIPVGPSRRILGISGEDWDELRRACTGGSGRSSSLPWYTDAVLERGPDVQRLLNQAIEPMLSSVDAGALIDYRGEVLLTDTLSSFASPGEREAFYAALGLIAAPFLPGFRAPAFKSRTECAPGSELNLISGPVKHIRIRFNSDDTHAGAIKHLLGVVSIDKGGDLFLAFLSYRMKDYNEVRFSLATSRCVFKVRELFGLAEEGERPEGA
jgi:helix-turn-helix, Psq domain